MFYQSWKSPLQAVVDELNWFSRPRLFIERAIDANAERESGRFQSAFPGSTTLKFIEYIPSAGLIYRSACDLDELKN